MALAATGKYLLYDASNDGDGLGGGAEPMAQAMRAQGKTGIYVLQGGIAAWVTAGYPTEAQTNGFEEL